MNRIEFENTRLKCIVADLIQELVNLGYDWQEIRSVASLSDEEVDEFLIVYKESESECE